MMRRIQIILLIHCIISVYSYSQYFKEVYNFEINDIFQYYTYGNAFGGEDPGLFTEITEKYMIMNKIVNGDTIIYEIAGQKLRHDFVPGECRYEPPTCHPHNWYYRDEINSKLIYVDSENHYLNRPVGSLVPFTWCDIYCDTVLTRIFTENFDNTMRKVLGGRLSDPNSNFYLYTEDTTMLDTINYNHWDIIPFSFPDDYILKFSNGLGLVEHEEKHFEYWFIKTLAGYVRNGDTTGTVWRDEDFTSTEKVIQDASFRIYPTIVQNNNILNLEYDGDFNDLKIISVDGRIQPFELVNKNSIRLIDAPGGIYFLVVWFGNRIVQEIFFKL